MKPVSDIDQLKELIGYEPETGWLIWKAKVSSKTVVGGRAGWSQASKGKPYLRYRFVSIRGRTYAAHRLAWALATGSWPKDQIDHVNGDGEDNRLVNLREARPFENSQNAVRRAQPRSGFTGVYWHQQANKWEAKITRRGATTYLGLFTSKDDARRAYLHAKSVIHTFNPAPRTTTTKAANDESNQTATCG